MLFVFWDTAPKGARHPYFQSHQMDCDGSWLDQIGFAPRLHFLDHSNLAVEEASGVPCSSLDLRCDLCQVVNRQGSHILKSGAHWGSAVLFPGEVMECLGGPAALPPLAPARGRYLASEASRVVWRMARRFSAAPFRPAHGDR